MVDTLPFHCGTTPLFWQMCPTVNIPETFVIAEFQYSARSYWLNVFGCHWMTGSNHDWLVLSRKKGRVRRSSARDSFSFESMVRGDWQMQDLWLQCHHTRDVKQMKCTPTVHIWRKLPAQIPNDAIGGFGWSPPPVFCLGFTHIAEKASAKYFLKSLHRYSRCVLHG